MVGPLVAPSRSEAHSTVSRSAVTIELDPGLRSQFQSMAGGRTLAIGYFTSSLCGRNVVIGDLELDWLQHEPTGNVRMPTGYVALAPLDGVGVVADDRLLELLATAGPTIVRSGLPFGFGPGVAMRLDDAAAWIDFLESPGARRPARPD